MARYKPKVPFSVPMVLLIPSISTSKGVEKKTFPDPADGEQIFGSFRTFGGTEYQVNDLFSVIDTAKIETWYRPDIKSDCRIYMCDTEQVYEVLGTPEDIEQRHQFMVFKVRAVKGGA